MAILDSYFGDYVVADYIIDQDSYVVGLPKAIASASFTLERVIDGAVTSASSYSWTARASPTVSATTTALSEFAQVTAAQRFAKTTISASTAATTTTTAKNVIGAATVSTSQSSQTTSGSNTANANQTLTAQITVTARTGVILQHSAVMSAQATQATTAQNRITGVLTISDAFTATQTARGTLQGDIYSDVVTAASITAAVTQSAQASATAESTVAVDGIPYVFASADWTVTATQDCRLNVDFTGTTTADSVFTDDVEGKILQIFSAEVAATATATMTTVGKNTITLAGEYEFYTWDSTAPAWPQWPYERWGFVGTNVQRVDTNQSATAVIARGVDGGISMTSAFGIAIGSVNIKPFALAVASEFTANIQGNETFDGGFAVSSAFTVTIINTNILLAQITPQAVVTQQTSGLVAHTARQDITGVATAAIRLGQISLNPWSADIVSTALILPEVVKSTAISMPAVSSVAAITATNVISGQQNITGQFANINNFRYIAGSRPTFTGVATYYTFAENDQNLTDIFFDTVVSTIIIGRELQPDPYRIVAATSENRSLRVYEENRVLVIPCQSRIVRVEQPPYDPVLDRRVA
jgi:hypothetical protein